MKKNFAYAVVACCALVMLASCKNEQSDSQSVNNVDVENISAVNLTVTKEDPILLKEVSQKTICVDEIELKQLDESFNGAIISANWLDDRIVVESFPKDKINFVELGVIDPEENSYKKISDIPFTASYKNNIEIISDRYYVTLNTCLTDNSSKGQVVIYDVEEGSVKIADEYDVHNIVQYVTAVGEDGFAYFYYEADTQDWVVKYYDLNSNETKEIFRHTNDNDILISPVALSYSYDDVILVLQSERDAELLRINIDNNSSRREKIDLNNFFGNDYFEIFDLEICNDYYFIQAEINDRYEYFSFRRNRNDFNVVLPAVYHLYEFDANVSENEMLFSGSSDLSGDKKRIYKVDVTGNTFESYSLYSTEDLDNIFMTQANDNRDLFILYRNNSDYSYQIADDFESYAKNVNTALFSYPYEQAQYAENNYSDEKAQEIKNACEETERNICNGDFRWKFIYG
ncbi:MAG: hypothetical protein NC093_02710 [Alistipes sp.]|nr:hypothetical protein [Alistipes sp.]